MDDRQRKVEAGAGLQESRLNQDFIDLVKKYGTTVLLVLLVIMASYVGWQRYTQWQEDKTDQAFADLDNAANTPAVLLSVAEQWDGRGSVWEIATLRAAKAYLTSARTRTELGVDPADVEEAELLSDDRVRASLEESITLFNAVLERTGGSKPIFAQDARWGLASANLGLAGLTSGEERDSYLDAAAQATQELVDAAEGTDANKVAAGTNRLTLIQELRSSPIEIYETAQLPEESQFQPDPMSDASSMTRDQMNPGAISDDNGNLNDLTPEQREMIQELLRGSEGDTDDPAPTLDTVEPPASDPENNGSDDPGSSDDPATEDPAQPGQ